MDITDHILSKTKRLVIHSEGEFTPGKQEWSCFNSGGVEIEVAEFLYSLVRMTKPKFILETGTHLGISALYMALGCQKNKKGSIWTCEVIPELQRDAKLLWNDLKVTPHINSILQPSLQVEIPKGLEIDLLFLDSEPQFRFDEFLRFWDKVSPGGFIVIHDLHPSLGHHGQTYHGVYDWPYGNWEKKLSRFVKDYDVQVSHFLTPRGLTIFQKTAPGFEVTKFLRDKK